MLDHAEIAARLDRLEADALQCYDSGAAEPYAGAYRRLADPDDRLLCCAVGAAEITRVGNSPPSRLTTYQDDYALAYGLTIIDDCALAYGLTIIQVREFEAGFDAGLSSDCLPGFDLAFAPHNAHLRGYRLGRDLRRALELRGAVARA